MRHWQRLSQKESEKWGTIKGVQKCSHKVGQVMSACSTKGRRVRGWEELGFESVMGIWKQVVGCTCCWDAFSAKPKAEPGRSGLNEVPVCLSQWGNQCSKPRNRTCQRVLKERPRQYMLKEPVGVESVFNWTGDLLFSAPSAAQACHLMN